MPPKYNKNNGPENVPLRKPINDLKLIVTVYDDKDEIIRQEEVQFSDWKDRSWLGKITAWACSNGYIVETKAVDKA